MGFSTAHGAHSIHHLVFVRETGKATQREERDEENGKKAIYSVYLYFSRTLLYREGGESRGEEDYKDASLDATRGGGRGFIFSDTVRVVSILLLLPLDIHFLIVQSVDSN